MKSLLIDHMLGSHVLKQAIKVCKMSQLQMKVYSGPVIVDLEMYANTVSELDASFLLGKLDEKVNNMELYMHCFAEIIAMKRQILQAIEKSRLQVLKVLLWLEPLEQANKVET